MVEALESSTATMARTDELRLMVKIARMYYQQGLTQTEIMQRLGIHQSTVSRILKRAQREGIVRTTISVPPGTHPELEEQLETTFGLDEAVVVETSEVDEDQLVRDLGSAAAYLMETILKPGEVIGISCWSAALLAMVESMRPLPRISRARVVQILGGVGSPGAPTHANNLTRRLAALLSADVVFLPAPGVVGSAQAKAVLLEDQFVRQALKEFEHVTLALVGIGAVEPSKMLAESGNVFSPAELRMLSQKGAVGDICLRFFDEAGRPVVTPLDERVISMELSQLRRVPRVVGVAGGSRKARAILGALRGRWVNVLVTDRGTAQWLVEYSRETQEQLATSGRGEDPGKGAAGSVVRAGARVSEHLRKRAPNLR